MRVVLLHYDVSIYHGYSMDKAIFTGCHRSIGVPYGHFQSNENSIVSGQLNIDDQINVVILFQCGVLYLRLRMSVTFGQCDRYI